MGDNKTAAESEGITNGVSESRDNNEVTASRDTSDVKASPDSKDVPTYNGAKDVTSSPANRDVTASRDADAAFRKHDYQKALDGFCACVEKGVDDAHTHHMISQCYFFLNQFDQSLKSAKAAVTLDPNLIDAYVTAGQAATKLREFQEAFTILKAGLKVDKKNAAIIEELRNLQCVILREHEQEKTTTGEQTYSAVKFCTQDPYPGDSQLLTLEEEILAKRFSIPPTPPARGENDPPPRPQEATQLAAAALQMKMMDENERAAVLTQQAVSMDPGNLTYKQMLAGILMNQGDEIGALKALWDIPKQNRSPDLWKEAGKILRELSLPVLAEFCFRRATRMTGGKDEEAAILFQQVRTGRLYDPMTSEFPVKVHFGQFGRSVIATRDIKKGEEAFHDCPVILAQCLQTRQVEACSHCAVSMLSPGSYFGDAMTDLDDKQRALVDELWPDVTPLPCPKCQRVRYCSEPCRQEAWDNYHQVICPGLNPASSVLYDLCEKDGWGYNAYGAYREVWSGHYSPMILARIWASIISHAKRLMKEAGLTSPTVEHWATAKAPFRRFIAYGCVSATERIPEMLPVLQNIFRDCGDGVSYDITEAEFNGRYYQATCNLQAFSSPFTPYHYFITALADDLRGIALVKHLARRPPEATFAGLFPLHACLNHACDNNVEVRDGLSQGRPGVSIRAKRDIAAGEELFITYIDTTMPRKVRRAWLFKSFNFWCQCRRCQFEGEDPTICTSCGATAPDGKKYAACGKCHKAWYCSRACQTKNWKAGHKVVCDLPHSSTSIYYDDE